jgi:peptidyl-prolyl cis-trans isomerase B (cyclophilin B)
MVMTKGTREKTRAGWGSRAIPLMLAMIAAVPCFAQTSAGAGPVIVLETAKGTIEIETYPEDAPKTVAQIVGLVKRGFYNGLRFHRVQPNFVIQVGDPGTRNMAMEAQWGRAGSGKIIGAAEITKKRRHIRGAVAMAYGGTDPKVADSQFYVMLRAAPELDGKHTVFGRVIKGMDVATRIQKADVVKKAYLKEATPSGGARP